MGRLEERYNFGCLKGRVSIVRGLMVWAFYLGPLMLLLLVSSCKRSVVPGPDQGHRSEAELIKDSVFYYYTLYSLWGDMLDPKANMNHSFSDAYETPHDVLNALKELTPYYPRYSGSIDRFSYLENIGESGLQSSLQEDTGSGFGLFISIGAVTNEVAYPVLYFVEGGSPAAKAGLTRSDVVLAVDEQEDLSIPVSCTSNGCQVKDEAKYQFVINILLAAMEHSAMELKVRHADNTESEIRIQSRSYEIDPVIDNEVFKYPDKNLGYLALSSFEDASVGSPFRLQLDQVFNGFEQGAIQDLILDLRYNTGGYVNAAEYLANKIISPEADGDLMYEYALNDYLSKHPESVDYTFANVYYNRANSLHLGTVYILVTDITASASELLINILRPYMNVVLIAEHNATYGKPVGFFKQEIMGKTALWAASFKLVNARGETDYWDGIGADIRNVTDYIFKDFGDTEELMIAAAIQHARNGYAQRRMIAPNSDTRQITTNINLVNKVPMRSMIK